eukprot:TRINITY_DN775937_c0_g1_i1.p1 TRINITY_DN775937_c0_g1~~TRINITY_DN775937_c0_g1_i1.p1  ORF type:complete len:150 (-),score=35.14 TRINITY_DN775937_c0_g1_i1:116-565(-)
MSEEKSELRANLERNGGFSYYYAHKNSKTDYDGADRIVGPDQKPRLLETKVVEKKTLVKAIEKYAFLDGKKSVRIYIDCDEEIPDEAISVSCVDGSLCVAIDTPKGILKLEIPKLSGKVLSAEFKRKKPTQIMVILKKQDEEKWTKLSQ